MHTLAPHQFVAFGPAQPFVVLFEYASTDSSVLLWVSAPVGITRATGVLAKADAFATKRSLPVAVPQQRANALDSLQVEHLHTPRSHLASLIGPLGQYARGGGAIYYTGVAVVVKDLAIHGQACRQQTTGFGMRSLRLF